VLRRCVWYRNIKNGCSIYIYIYIYIYDISRLRVKHTTIYGMIGSRSKKVCNMSCRPTDIFVYSVEHTVVKLENNQISQTVQHNYDSYGWKKIVKFIKTGYSLFLGFLAESVCIKLLTFRGKVYPVNFQVYKCHFSTFRKESDYSLPKSHIQEERDREIRRCENPKTHNLRLNLSICLNANKRDI